MSAKKRKGRKNDRTPIENEEPYSAERTPVPERPEPKKFNAPLWAGAIVAVALAAVLLFNAFSPKEHLTVDSLNKPVVAALDGGSKVYPANSKLAFTENTKFGYLPAPTLTALGDGTIVAADPKTAPKNMGLKDGLESLDAKSFLDQTITPPRKDTAPGDPITWGQLVDMSAGSTVLMPLIDSAEVAGPALDTITEAKDEDATIVRTDNPEVAKAASDADIAVMFSGDPATVNAEELSSEGFTMIAVPAEGIDNWLDSDLDVWATGVEDKAQLDDLGKQGIFGALSTNPYTIQPSDVKTD